MNKDEGKENVVEQTLNTDEQTTTKTSDKKDARNWHIHELYEYSVQSPETDVDFLERIYTDYYNKSPICIREDFCGTAIMACEWAKRSKNNYAIGVDLDLETLQWGYENHIKTKLDEDAQKRIWLHYGDVLNGVPHNEISDKKINNDDDNETTVTTKNDNKNNNNNSNGTTVDTDTKITTTKTDQSQQQKKQQQKEEQQYQVCIISAHNFSWMLFRDRKLLRNYFKKCREGLRKDGVLVLDIYGGPDSQAPCHETTTFHDKGFTYHWIQESYDPITNHVKCGIYFSFPRQEQESTTSGEKDDERKQEKKNGKNGNKTTTTTTPPATRTTNITSVTTMTDKTNPVETDGPIMKGFDYDFRLYSIPEICEILLGVHFKKVQVYWEVEKEMIKMQQQKTVDRTNAATGTSASKSNNGNTPKQKQEQQEKIEDDIYDGNFGDFEPAKSAKHSSCWMAYIAAYNS